MGAQVRKDRLSHPHGAEEVHVHMRPDLFLRGFLHHAVEQCAGVVDDDVQPAERSCRPLHPVEHGPTVGDIQRMRDQAVGVLLGQFLQRLDVAGDSHYAVAARQGGLGEGPAQAAGCAGDEPDSCIRHNASLSVNETVRIDSFAA
ncbi:hypothetical protein SHKM778_45880 [Streptomyces sp. KM77-8]|uniref:Uncharacterized protein n=1 Tax=Streptomyces haneummycinicus TaxID=3074435 RepID=A0AAT9HLG6_9ACTN